MIFSIGFAESQETDSPKPCPSIYPYCECTASTLKECSEEAKNNTWESWMNWCKTWYAEMNLKIITLLEKKAFFKNLNNEKIIALRDKLIALQAKIEEKEPDLINMYTDKDMTKSPYFLKWYLIKLLNMYITNEILKDYSHCFIK
jgi:hypothetical protein